MNPIFSRLQRTLSVLTTGTGAMRSWRWLLAGLVVAVGWLALSPAPPELLSTGWDKLNHASAFTALAFTGVFAFRCSRSRMLLLVLALLAFGGLIEIVQSFTPTRNAEWADLLADAVGIAAGSLVALLVARLAAAQLR